MPDLQKLKQVFRENPRKAGMYLSLFGAGLILLSVPLKWEEAYVTGLGENGGMSMFSGFFIVIEAALIFGIVLFELMNAEEKPISQAGVIAVLCLMTLLYAVFTLFGVLMVGSSEYGGLTAGVRTGPGLWLAIVGSLICGVGQGLAVGFDLPLFQVQRTARRCAKCGAKLTALVTEATECPSCGADWSSPDTPPPLPDDTPVVAPPPSQPAPMISITSPPLTGVTDQLGNEFPGVHVATRNESEATLYSDNGVNKSRGLRRGRKRQILIFAGAVATVLLVVFLLFRHPAKTASTDFTGAEVAELVRLLMNDPELQAGYLNGDGPVNGTPRLIPYRLWNALLGEPQTKAIIQDKAHWIYGAADGQVGITLGSGLLDEDAPVPWIRVWTIDNTVSVSGQSVDREKLRKLVLRVKRQIDKELESSGAIARLNEQREEWKREEEEIAAKQAEEDRQREIAWKEEGEKRQQDHDRTEAWKDFENLKDSLPNVPAKKDFIAQSEDWITRRAEVITKTRKQRAAKADQPLAGSKDRGWTPPLPSLEAILSAVEAGEPPLVSSVKSDAGPTANKSEVGQTASPAPSPKTIPSSVWLPDGPAGLIREFRGHEGTTFSVGLSPDGTTLVTGGEDGAVILWDVVGGKEIRRLERPKGAVRAVAFSPQNDHILAATSAHTLYLWRGPADKSPREFKSSPPSTFYAAAFTPNGKWIAAGDFNGAATIFDSKTGEQHLRIDAHKPSSPDEDVSIPALAVSSDGHMLSTASRDDTVRLWNMQDGNRVGEFNGHQSDVWSVALSSDSKRALSGGYNSELYVWDVTTGQAIHRLQGHAGTVTAVAFLPDGRHAVTGSIAKDVGALILWDTETGKEIMRFPKQTAQVRGFAISPDGRFFVTAGADGIVRLFRVPHVAAD